MHTCSLFALAHAGDMEAGVSIMEIAAGAFDHGRVLHSTRIPLPPTWHHVDLSSALATIGANDLMYVLRRLPGIKRHAVRQDDMVPGIVTHAPKVTKEDMVVDWARHDATHIIRMHRAFSGDGWVRTQLTSGRGTIVVHLVGIFEPSVADYTEMQIRSSAPPATPAGSFTYDKQAKCLWIRCVGGGVLGCRELMEPTRRPQTAAVFANAHGLRNGVAQFENAFVVLGTK